MVNFKEYMTDKNLVSRSKVLVIGLTGALFGAILMYIFMLAGLVM